MRGRIRAQRSEVSSLPQKPGVYIYRNTKGEVIYVGMSGSLRDRVRSYFSLKLEPKTRRMMMDASTLDFIVVGSEFEALLLEAKLIKKYLPKYNVQSKDDKSELYVAITKEEVPRIITLHKTQLNSVKTKKVYGPFVDSRSVKIILRRLRKVFAYGTHKPGRRPCVNAQIGLCDPCPSEFVSGTEEIRKRYMDNIRGMQKLLGGKLKGVRAEMERKMDGYSKEQNFEAAREVLKQIRMLDYVTSEPINTSAYLADPNLIEDIREREVRQLAKIVNQFYKTPRLGRIECFDVAHLAGTFPTASMVTFIEGEAEKKLYRHFGIRSKKKSDDVNSMREVIRRRMKNFQNWGEPDLIIVDGGKGQVGAASEELSGRVPVVGIEKRWETLVFLTPDGFEKFRLPEGPAKKLVQRMRDESHRFARRYHHKLVGRAIKGKW